MKFKRLKEMLQNKKGMFSIEYAITLMIFLMILTFTLDFAVISVKRNSMSQFSQTVVRQVRVQSGLERTMPDNFPGTESTYVTTDQIRDAFFNKLQGLGLDSDGAEMVIEGINTSGSKQTWTISEGSLPNVLLDYQSPFTVKLTFKYRWGFFSSFMTSDPEKKFTVKSTGITEYNRDADQWEDE